MITPKVMVEINRWKNIGLGGPYWIAMNPADVTQLACEQIQGQFATWEQQNPVPLDRRTNGCVFMGIDLSSDPAVPPGKLWINSSETEIAL